MWFSHKKKTKYSLIKERSGYFASLVKKMFRLCVLFSTLSYVFASHVDSWPFTLADKYIEDFKSNVDTLQSFANNYNEEQHKEALFDWEHHDLNEAIKRK
jgi:hypothetical protein